MTQRMKFNVSRAKNAMFETGGLREFFEYRDLGIKKATGGAAHAQVIRAKKGSKLRAGWHKHVLNLQLIYILSGWVRFEYEGVGEICLRPGDCVHQPPNIPHREISHSEDLELIEITLPADFDTLPATSAHDA
tara:strand:+ start:1347 stop:1745 length:399 start_codon:yes stop_codon:yes gene_type:complete